MIDDKIKDISNRIGKTLGSDDEGDEIDDDDVVERGDDLRNRLRETGGEIRVEKSQIPELVDFLSSERVDDRVNASRALVEVAQHYPEEVESHLHAVTNLLDDEDNKVRKHACITLGVVGSEDAIDDLESVMEGADEEVKIAAEKAIRHIRKQHSGEVEAVTDDTDEETEDQEAVQPDEDRPEWAGGGADTADETTEADADASETTEADADAPETTGGVEDASADASEETAGADDAGEITPDEDRPAWAGGTPDEDDEVGDEPEAEDEAEEETEDEEAVSGETAAAAGQTSEDATEDLEEAPAADTADEQEEEAPASSEAGDETDEIKEVPEGGTGMEETDTGATGTDADAASAEADETDREIHDSIEAAIQDLDHPLTELPGLVMLWLLAEGDESTRRQIDDAVEELVGEYPDAVADSTDTFIEAAQENQEEVAAFASTVVDAITEHRPEALEDEIPYLMESVRSADEEIRQRAKEALTKIAERSPDKVVDEIADRDD